MGHFQLLLVNLLKNKMAANLGDVWIFEEGWGQMFVSCISPQEKSSPRCLAPLDKDLLRMHCAVIKVEETNPSHETSTPKRKFCPKKKHCTHWSYQLWRGSCTLFWPCSHASLFFVRLADVCATTSAWPCTNRVRLSCWSLRVFNLGSCGFAD